MSVSSFDVAIIGGGPGGYVAAIRAAQLGFKTCVIEREHLGGICLNWGCIPTKALLRSSELYHLMARAEEFGLSVQGGLSFDLQKIVERSRKVAKKLSQGIGFLMKKHKITVIEGHARLQAPGQIEVEGDREYRRITAPHIIIATGARARTLPGLEPDGKRIWTYKEALQPDIMPRSLIVIGSGAIGVEFASFFNTLGAETTVVELVERILPVEDEEISKLAHKAFQKQGMTLHTGTKVTGLTAHEAGVTAVLDKGGEQITVHAERAILAIGITGNVENLGLEELGVAVEKGHIVTDRWGAANIAGIYAIGDVAGAPWLAHKASHEGVVCVERIAGVSGVHPLNKANIPGCTYCWPQIASVGLTESAARAAGHDVRVGRFPYQANGKAIALGETEGLIKTVFDAKTGELLGAHMIGAEVTELVQGFALARTLETTEAELMQTIFPHPTLSEMMHESVLDAFDKVLHI